jgi:hypothetical protein
MTVIVIIHIVNDCISSIGVFMKYRVLPVGLVALTAVGCTSTAESTSATQLATPSSTIYDISSCVIKPFAECPNKFLSNVVQPIDLSGVDLHGANLVEKGLEYANLTGANLKRTIIDNVVWDHTTCPNGSNSDANFHCGYP